MKKIIALLFILISINFSINSQNTFVRFPAISPDGLTLAFSYHGDIWTMPISGGKASRITIHEAYESNPKWSPDGKQIAFSSNRFGNDDVFIIEVNGGFPKRITWHSTNDLLTDWSHSNNLIFESNRNYRQVEWESEFHSVSSKGETPTRLIDGLGNEATISHDGKFIAFVIGECRVSREQYQGSANKDIWIYDVQKKSYNQITSFEGQDFNPIWTSDNELYFLSAKPGKYNIFKVNIDNLGKAISDPKQITDENDEGIRNFDISNDNKTIVFEKDINLYSIPAIGGKANKILIDISSDYRFDPYENKTYTNQIGEYDISPNGKYSAFIIHGELFISENDKKKNLTKNLSNSPYREKDITWLNDSSIVFSSDKDGQFDLFMVKSDDPKQGNIFKTLKLKTTKLTNSNLEEHSSSISPNGNQIAFIRGGNYGKMKLISAEIDKTGSIKNEKILVDGWSAPNNIQWSPDSKWLAYSMQDLTFNHEIYIQAADNSKKPVNISMHPGNDHSPIWSNDGSKLGFISDRNNSDNDVWFVWLKKEDFQKTKEDWDEDDEPKKASENSDNKKTGKDKTEKKEIKPIKIDFENIYERLRQVTSLSGSEGNIAISDNGKTFYFSSVSVGKPGHDLFKINWDGTEIENVTQGGISPRNVKLEKDGKFLYMNIKGNISRISTSGKELENMPIAAKMTIDYFAELDQVFEEAWRSLRDGFYDPDFHGQDWNLLKKKYKPYCMAASTKTDFIYMYNNMLGQLNASHMGLYGKDREETQKEITALPGIIVKPLKTGVIIDKVIYNSPADKLKSKLFKGDIILAVNGIGINENMNFWSSLSNKANTNVLLNVKDQKGVEREVVIRPGDNLREELYNEWVKDRRALTEKYSGGKLGYLHIKGMDMTGFERFERELTAAGFEKEAIVIDVRFNGGGWTTDYLMAILNVKQHAYTIPRGAANSLKEYQKYREYYPFAERLPFFVWNKPSIAICNSASYSNAEIFSHAYKNLKIGSLVGEPTFGAVISTSGLGLIDGSFVRMPFRAWFVKADNKNMETDPAFPDVLITNSVDFKSKAEDEQLKKACEILLKQISK